MLKVSYIVLPSHRKARYLIRPHTNDSDKLTNGFSDNIS